MGRYWKRVKSAIGARSKGFTIVEVLVIAPVTILAIGALIVMIVALTGDVLKTRGSNTMAFEIQDALSQIESDIKQSGAFLSSTNINPLISPQGFDNNTAAFTNVGDNGNMLILNAYATKENPDTNPASIVFNKNQPNTCGDSENENLPLMINVVYFVKNGSLWRRTIMPEQYSTMGCSVPWQQPSCAPGITGTMCQVQDTKLVEGIEDPSADFTITYYASEESTTPLEDAVNPANSVELRQQSLIQAAVARVTINTKRVFAGNEITKSGEIRGVSKNNNILESLGRTAPIITLHPSEKVVTKGSNTTFTATATGTDLSIQWQESTDKGKNWYPIAGATSTTLSVNSISMTRDGNRYRAVFYNDFASSVSEAAALYVYDSGWNTLTLQNSWTNYGSPYSTAKYRKTSDGVVVVQGLIKRSSTPGSGNVIANLPVGYRPTNGQIIFLNATNSNAAGYINVTTGGDIQFVVGNGGWFSLDSINFMPDNGRYERKEVTQWANGFDNYNRKYGSTAYENVAYTVGGNGRVHLSGLLGGSVFSSGVHMFMLPQELRPNTHLFTSGRSNGWAEYGISSDSVKTQGTGSSYISMQNIFYPASYNGWSNLPMSMWKYYGSYAPPRYTKAPDGLVTLSGIVLGNNASSYGYDTGIIAVLPVGSRPDSRLLVHAVNSATFMRLDIDTAGQIKYMGSIGDGWVSLDGISFFAG